MDAIRFLHVLDDATDIKVMVVVPSYVQTEGGRKVLRAAGFGVDPESSPNVIVTDLTTLRTGYDPFKWGDATMRAFHLGISDAPDLIASTPDGGSINVRAWRLRG